MPNSNIIIFSRPIGSGKTTELSNWLMSRNNIGGFLTPVIEKKRMMMDLRNHEIHEFETNDSDQRETMTIGKYIFLLRSFEWARNYMQDVNQFDLFVVDEAGKLEVEQDKGFEPALGRLILQYQQLERQGQLLTVVRDTLLEKAVTKYKLQHASVARTIDELNNICQG